MTARPIDVWDVTTFDPELAALLHQHHELICNHIEIDRQIFCDYDLGRGAGTYYRRPDNPYAASFIRLKELVGTAMESRTIRAFHYTRLTDAEADNILAGGIHLSTPESLRARLNRMIDAGHMTAEQADALYAASPFHSEQLEARHGKFWMTSHPIVAKDGGVVPLMAAWGGEVASMWVIDNDLLAPAIEASKPRIIELGVPLLLTRHSFSASQAIIATFGRSLGLTQSRHGFDLYLTSPLPPSAILAVHSEGDASFDAMGRGYPPGYVNPDITYWRELTGEDD